jgi:hypothetical protein
MDETEIAKLREESKIAQANYETVLKVYELSSEEEKKRLGARVSYLLTRREETLVALAAALRAQEK